MSSRLIVHQIVKDRGSETTDLHLRASLLTSTTADAGALIDRLRLAITRGNPHAGRFTSPAGAQPPLQQRLLRYMRKQTDNEFVSFSRNAAGHLRNEMAKSGWATGGYIVFAEHKHGEETFLLVVLLSTHAQPSFDADLNLVSATTLDFAHMRHAARLRYSGVEQNEDSVVHFVSRNEKGVSDYFQDFLGCEELTDSSQQGRFLQSALRYMARDKGMNKETVMQQTYTYWKGCREAGKSMTVTALANLLAPDDPDPILEYLGDPKWGLAGEFSPPIPSIMKNFLKFAFDGKGLKIEFDRDDWLGNIRCTDTTVTIRNAPASLIEQIQNEKR